MYLKKSFCIFFLYFCSTLIGLPLGLQGGITDYTSTIRLSDIPYWGISAHLPAGKQTDLMFTLEHSFGRKALDDAAFFSLSDTQFLAQDTAFSYTAIGAGGHYFLRPDAKGAFLFLVPKWVFFSGDTLTIMGGSVGFGAGLTYKLGRILVRPQAGLHLHTMIGQWYQGGYYDFDSPKTSFGYQFSIQVNTLSK